MGREALREVRVWPGRDDRHVRGRLQHAILLAVGELGYQPTSVEDVLKRSGFSRDRFYRSFDSKQDCFEAAHQAAWNCLYKSVIDAALGESDWQAQFRAGLAEFLRFVASQPLVAKAVFVEAFAAGSAISAQYDENLRRFLGPLDTARREPGARLSIPPLTARFMLGGIEETVRRMIGFGETEHAESMLDDLTHFVVLNYFGSEAPEAVAVA